jgi:hypothetical protein
LLQGLLQVDLIYRLAHPQRPLFAHLRRFERHLEST